MSRLAFGTCGPVVIAALLVGISACGPSPALIRFRAQRPTLQEAERKIRIALEADGYTVRAVAPAGSGSAGGRGVAADWKDLTEAEQGEVERGSGGVAQGKVTVFLAPRGMLYDVEGAVETRSITPRDTVVHAPDTRHPLMQKWQRVLTNLLTPEERSED